MAVKTLNRKCFFYLISILLFYSLINTKECNLKLVQYFDMTGSKFPVRSPMDICSKMEENCCTPSDELKITTLWNEFSVMKIDRYIAQIFHKYRGIIIAHQQILEIDSNLIEIKRSTIKSIPYDFKICERTTLLEDLMDPVYSKIDLLNHNKILDLPGFDARKIKRGDFKIPGGVKRYLTDDINSVPLTAKRSYRGKMRKLISDSKLKKQTKKKHQKKQKRNLMKKTQNKKQKNTKMNQKNTPKIIKTDKLKNRKIEQNTNETQKKIIKKQLLHFAKRMITKQNNVVAENTETTENESQPRKTQDQKYAREFVFDEELPERHAKCKSTSKMIHKEVTIENNFKNQYCLGLKAKIVDFRIDDFEDYIRDIKVVMLKIINFKQTFYCSICDNALQKYIDTDSKTITFHEGFCRGLVWEFKDYIRFQNIVFIGYVDLIIQYMRCFQTTAEEKVFPYPNFLENYKSQFKYIEGCISHIDNENFMEHCVFLCDKFSYTTFSPFWDGNLEFLTKVLFLITSFVRKIKTNQPLTIDYQGIEDELKTIENVDFENPFYKKAAEPENRKLKVKKQTKSNKVKLVKNKNKIELKNKLRKLGYELQDRDIEAENEAKAEHAKVMIKRLENLQEIKGDFREVEEKENQTVYEQRESLSQIKTFQSKFVKDAYALDPIIMQKYTNLNPDSISAIQKKCTDEKLKFGPLDQAVILEYFSFSSEDIENFHTDLFLPIADYSFFEDDDEKRN